MIIFKSLSTLAKVALEPVKICVLSPFHKELQE